MQDSQDASGVESEGASPASDSNADARASIRLRVAVEHPPAPQSEAAEDLAKLGSQAPSPLPEVSASPIPEVEQPVAADPTKADVAEVTPPTEFQLPPFVIPKRVEQEDEPLEDETLEDQPLTNQLAEDQPFTKQPANDQPLTKKPAEDQPFSKQLANDQPLEEHPAGEQPLDKEAAEDHPKQEAAANELPIDFASGQDAVEESNIFLLQDAPFPDTPQEAPKDEESAKDREKEALLAPPASAAVSAAAEQPSAVADPASALPPFERAVGVLRASEPTAANDENVHAAKGLHASLHLPHMTLPHFTLPHISRPTSLPHIPFPPFLQTLIERIPEKIRPIVLSVFAALIAGIIFTMFHLLLGKHTQSQPPLATMRHADAPRSAVSQQNAKKALLVHKHILDGMLSTSEEPGPPPVTSISKEEMRQIAASVPTTCSIHGEKVMKWNFVDGYLVCVVRLKESIGTYVLQRDETGYTYLGGLIESPNQEGIAELGVPLETAKALISHFHTI